MKALLILAILSLSTYANAGGEMICYADAFVKTRPVRLIQVGQDFKMTYTRTDNSEVEFKLAVSNKDGNKYAGEIQYSEYGDIYSNGTFELVLPATHGSGSLSYKFNNADKSTDVALRCSRADFNF